MTVSSTVDIRLPQNLEGWISTSLSDMLRVFGFFSREEKDFDLRNFSDTIVMYRHWNRALDALFREDGIIKNSRGEAAYEVPDETERRRVIAGGLLGMKTVDFSRTQQLARKTRTDEVLHREGVKRTVKNLVDFLETGSGNVEALEHDALVYFSTMSKEAIRQSVKNEFERRKLDPVKRILLHGSKLERLGILPYLQDEGLTP